MTAETPRGYGPVSEPVIISGQARTGEPGDLSWVKQIGQASQQGRSPVSRGDHLLLMDFWDSLIPVVTRGQRVDTLCPLPLQTICLQQSLQHTGTVRYAVIHYSSYLGLVGAEGPSGSNPVPLGGGGIGIS